MTVDFLIIPYESVGLIKFGMNKNEVRQIFNEEFDGQHNFQLGLKIQYDDKGLCKSVELKAPANPILKNRKLLKGRSLNYLKHWLGELDDELYVTGRYHSEVLSPRFGITTYHRFADDIYKRPESILICSKENYQEILTFYLEEGEEDDWLKPKLYKDLPKEEILEFNEFDEMISETVIHLWFVEGLLYYMRFGFFREYKDSRRRDIYTDYDDKYKEPFKDSFTTFSEWREFLSMAHPENHGGNAYGCLTDGLDPYLLRWDKKKSWTEREVQYVCPQSQEYVKAFSRWSEISRGAFLPKNVQEIWESETGPIRLEFTLNEERHFLYPEYCEQWLDLEILLDINQLIEGTEYQFKLSELIKSKLVVVLTEEEEREMHLDRSLEFEGNNWIAWRRS